MCAMTLAKDALCIKKAIVTGTTVSTDITVTGIATEDVLIYVESRIIYDTTVDQITDVTANCTITAADTIQCTDNTSTNGAAGILVTDAGKLLVEYADASA